MVVANGWVFKLFLFIKRFSGRIFFDDHVLFLLKVNSHEQQFVERIIFTAIFCNQ